MLDIITTEFTILATVHNVNNKLALSVLEYLHG